MIKATKLIQRFGMLCTLCFFHLSAQADRDPFLGMEPIPQSGANVQSFIPKGWYIESKVEGDLDGNGTLDSIVVIRDVTKKQIDEEIAQDDESVLSDGDRGLMVLLKGPDGKYRFAGLAKNTLLCTRCYGMMFNPHGGNPDIKIKNQVIVIKQFTRGDDGENRNDTLRFRYDKALNRVRLIGADFEDTERGACVTQTASINYLTNTKISSTLVCDENPDKIKPIPQHKEKIDPKVWYLEDYHYFENPE